MWKAIRKFVQEYRELPDEGKQLLAKESLRYLCYYYITWQKEKEKGKQDAEQSKRLREIAEREFVPFSYWDVLFKLPGEQTYAIEVIDYESIGGNSFISAQDKYGTLMVAEDAIMLRATEVIVDSVDRLPDWCPLFKCEFGTYRTSPKWAKEIANAND